MPPKARSSVPKFRSAGTRRPGRIRDLWRNGVALGGLFLALLVLLAGLWIERAADRALKDQVAQGLDAMAATSAAALEFWIGNELRTARHWSELRDVRTAAEGLAAVAIGKRHPREDLLAAREGAELLVALKPLGDSDDYVGFGLVSRDGLVLAASIPEQVGRTLTKSGLALLADVMRGRELLTRPYHRAQLLSGAPEVLDEPLMLAIAPVRNERQEVVGAFYLVIRTEKDFARILSIAGQVETADIYVFGSNGLMLSDSRHEPQLKALGLIPREPGARAILRIQLRDPGGDLTRGYRPQVPLAERPLTRLVEAATTGESPAEVLVEPYRDYRGVRVVGAYRWMPKYDVGLATEVSADWAFAATRPLHLMVRGLLWLLVLGAVLIGVSGIAVQRLRGRVEEVKELGQYTLEQKLGAGGMGEVYRARHALLHRPTAVKFIRPNQVSETNLERFEREVQRTSELTSPNTIDIYDFGCTEEGVFYYVMEYLPGLDLGDMLENHGAMPVSRAVHILKQVCASLAEAHARGLIHRDIKPPNVFLTERGGLFDFVKVLDFGLVRDISEQGDSSHELAGTLPYVAPERILDAQCQDPRSDIYSVGVIAFNLLTGRQPFEGTSAEIAYHVVNSPAPRVSKLAKKEIPPDLDTLVAECLAANPDERPASVEMVIARLDVLTIEQPWDQKAARQWWATHAQRTGSSG